MSDGTLEVSKLSPVDVGWLGVSVGVVEAEPPKLLGYVCSNPGTGAAEVMARRDARARREIEVGAYMMT